MSDDFILITLDHIDETQRTLIQSYVEQKTDTWWHQQANVWLVKGGDVATWQEGLGVFVPKKPSSLFVWKLPAEGSRAWSARGDSEHFGWILDNYAQTHGRSVRVQASSAEAKELE